MAESTRKSRLAIKEETAGIPVAPTSGSDYLAVQSGYSLKPNIAKIENAELKAGLGASKPVLGLENPEASLSHYIYGSGTAGVEPETGPLMKGVFGSVVVASTEYNILSATAGTSSVPATITLNTGEGANFQRGQAVMIKYPSGSILRNVEDVTGDVLTLSFNLPNTTGLVGTGLGKAILYKAASDDSLPSLSVWDYRANGGAVQMMSGSKVTEFGIEAKAGEAINSSYSLKGVSYYFNPVEINATSDTIDFTGDAGLKSASLAHDFYKDPIQAASALATAMTSVAGGQTISVVYSNSTGKFTVSATGALFSVNWASTTNSLGAKFGFTANDTGSLSYVSDVAQSLVSPQTPVLDGQDPLVAKSNSVLLGEFFDNYCVDSGSISFKLSNEIKDVKSFCADSGISEKIPSARTVSIAIDIVLKSAEAKWFDKFYSNKETRFAYAFGPKSGGSFQEGKSGVLYIPKCTISEFSVDDQDGYAIIKLNLAAYTASGENEVYFNYI